MALEMLPFHPRSNAVIRNLVDWAVLNVFALLFNAAVIVLKRRQPQPSVPPMATQKAVLKQA